MGYNSSSGAGINPWIPDVLLGLPIETAGKRGIRISQAQSLSEAARLDVLDAAWAVVVTGIILAPAAHRMLHSFHTKRDGDQ